MHMILIFSFGIQVHRWPKGHFTASSPSGLFWRDLFCKGFVVATVSPHTLAAVVSVEVFTCCLSWRHAAQQVSCYVGRRCCCYRGVRQHACRPINRRTAGKMIEEAFTSTMYHLRGVHFFEAIRIKSSETVHNIDLNMFSSMHCFSGNFTNLTKLSAAQTEPAKSGYYVFCCTLYAGSDWHFPGESTALNEQHVPTLRCHVLRRSWQWSLTGHSGSQWGRNTEYIGCIMLWE